MPEKDGFEIRWIFAVIRRWWWMIVCGTLLAGITAYLFSTNMTPIYEASTTVLVQPAQSSTSSELTTLLTGQSLALTYSQMMKSAAVLNKVIEKLELVETVEKLSKKVSIEPENESQLIHVNVKDPSPKQAARLADTIAEVFSAYIKSLLSVRYTKSLENMQTKIDLLQAVIVETQAQIDKLNSVRNESQAKISTKEELIAEYRTDYRSLEQDYQEIKLIISQIAEQVSVIEAANVPDSTLRAPYIATAKILVKSIPNATDATHSTQTYAQMLSSRQVVEAAIAELSLGESPDAIIKRLNIELIPDSRILQLEVRDTDRERAVLLAGAVIDAFQEEVQVKMEKPYVDRLADIQLRMDVLSATINNIQQDIETLSAEVAQAETEISRLEDLVTRDRSDSRTIQNDYDQLSLAAADAAEAVILSDPAQVPIKPVSPRPLLNTVMAFLIGGMLAVGLAFFIESLDDTIKTPEDISRNLGLSTIGVIGVLSNEEKGLIVETQPRSPAAEAFRALAANIRYAGLDKPVKTLLVTSPHPQDGKTFLAGNLAAAIAQTEDSVIVIDADLRQPSLHKLFDKKQAPGLTESILENSVDGYLSPIRAEHLSILTSGEVPPNPTEVIASQRMHSILIKLTKKATLIVIDSPPLLVAADSKALATQVDGVLLVLKAGQTTLQAAREAVESLRQVKAKIIGVVLNAEPRKKNSYYYYQYHDGHTRPVSRWQQWLNNLRYKLPRLPRKK